jgi:hypothetical protein
MAFQVTTTENNDLSLLDLVALQKSGYSVVRSPHVGNLYPLNMLALMMGIPLNLYDRNYGKKDANYHPHTVIIDGQQYQVADPERMVCQAAIERVPPPPAEQFFAIGEPLAGAHTTALKSAFPDHADQITVFSTYLSDRTDLALQLLKPAFLHKPQLWHRYVRQDGSFQKNLSAPSSWHRLREQGILSVTDDSSGWLIPLELVTVLDGVIEGLEHDNFDVYHLSGPAMIEYIDQKKALMQSLYEAIREHGQLDLPEHVWFHVVPFANIPLIAPPDQVSALRESLRLARLIGVGKRRIQKKGSLLSKQETKHQAVPQFRSSMEEAVRQLTEALGRCSDVDPDLSAGTFFSQYDVFAEGKPEIPPGVTGWSLERAGRIRDRLEEYRPD